MEERWLTVAYCAHGLFCDCKEPKKHLEKCLSDAIADAGGDPHGDGGEGDGGATFDIGIDALLAAADITSGADTGQNNSKPASETPAPFPAPTVPEIHPNLPCATPPRYTKGSSMRGIMTMMELLEKTLSKNSLKSQQTRKRRRHTLSLGQKQRNCPPQTKKERAIPVLRATHRAKKARKKRDTEDSTTPASEDSSSTSTDW
uniref:ORF2/2 n=1 Tax=Torque teno sus virus 1b TaxID=687387 RepID=E2IVJ1_9VIRU|nr:ORF2/2 [Torque teno sus virus 1b]